MLKFDKVEETPEQDEERRNWLIKDWKEWLEHDKEQGLTFSALIMEAALHLLENTKKDTQEIEQWANETLKWSRRF